MPHPQPEYPTNVQASNPYQGKDRGLFLIHTPAPQYARVHAARWQTNGPTAAIGILEFQIMAYDSQPVTDQDYLAGTLLTAPGGDTWFDCLTRGSLIPPVVAEYWAKNSYQTWYGENDAPALLTEEEKQLVLQQGATFTQTMGKPYQLDSIDFVITYNQTLGQPLSRSSMALTFTHGPVDNKQTVTLTEFSQETFDPVQYAMAYLKSSVSSS